MYKKLRDAGKPYNIEFGAITKTSNSHLALEASEFARDHGHYDSFHHRVFRAFFTEVRDIGDMDVLLDLAKDDGLDPAALAEALREKRYAPRLDNARREAEKLGITAVPTFIINGGQRMVGVQSIDFFRSRLKEIQAEHSS
jgi:predicted DsbA family dithiol-disulfide isomerase